MSHKIEVRWEAEDRTIQGVGLVIRGMKVKLEKELAEQVIKQKLATEEKKSKKKGGE